MFIDADTHVDESEDTWSYFPKSMEDLRPLPLAFEDGQPGFIHGRHYRGWFIDGQLFARLRRSDEVTGTTKGARELHDISSRLANMDEVEVDVQVLYPSLLLFELTARPELERAICESYNRWLGDRCAQSGGRLRWAAVLPLRSIPDALVEMRRAKDLGASAIFKRGFECDGRNASDPYFGPVYELAQELDLPICIHTAFPYSGNAMPLTKLQKGLHNTFYVQDAFLSILRDGIPRRYPRLRFGFVEAAAAWVPHVYWLSGFQRVIDPRDKNENLGNARGELESALVDSRIFVTCEATEDIGELVEKMGNSLLLVGSDYGHNDRASVRGIQQRVAQREDLDSETVRKLTRENAARLYGIG